MINITFSENLTDGSIESINIEGLIFTKYDLLDIAYAMGHPDEIKEAGCSNIIEYIERLGLK